MRPVTRRAVLAGTTAVAATLALGSDVAQADSLPRLLAEHERVERAYIHAEGRADEVFSATKDAFPEMPRAIMARTIEVDGTETFKPWNRDWATHCRDAELAMWSRHQPQIEAKFSKIFAGLDTHDARCKAMLAEAGHPRLAACRTEVRENGCGRIAMWRGHGIERLS